MWAFILLNLSLLIELSTDSITINKSNQSIQQLKKNDLNEIDFKTYNCVNNWIVQLFMCERKGMPNWLVICSAYFYIKSIIP